jgi:hypothetical protein
LLLGFQLINRVKVSNNKSIYCYFRPNEQGRNHLVISSKCTVCNLGNDISRNPASLQEVDENLIALKLVLPPIFNLLWSREASNGAWSLQENPLYNLEQRLNIYGDLSYSMWSYSNQPYCCREDLRVLDVLK